MEKRKILWLALPLALAGAALMGILRPDVPDPMGSVGLLTQPTTLYSVYLDRPEAAWSREDRQFQAAQLALALDWLEERAGEYGVSLSLTTQVQDSALAGTVLYEGPVGEGTGPLVSDFDAWAREVCAGLGEDSPTEGVGVLFFLPGPGNPYTVVYDSEYSEEYYWEYSVFYQYALDGTENQWPGPAVLAHEILHLFGALDLYPGQQGVSQATARSLAAAYPREIMVTVRDSQGQVDLTGMDQTLSPFTAWRVGLTGDPGPFGDCPEAAWTPGVWTGSAFEE